MAETQERPTTLNLDPAKRCPDYDDECALVKDHAACFAGGVKLFPGLIAETPPADGYCPFLLGMMRIE